MEFNKICVGAGHTPSGTAGCGAIGNLVESNCTREIAPLVVQYLKQGGVQTNLQIVDKGNSYNCEDCYVRAENSNSWGADFYVEIHLNAGEGNGCEVEVCSFGGKAEEVARRVSANISNSLGIPNRGVNQMNLIVLNKTNCPAILVECLFCDSSDTNKYDPNKIAKSIAEGILNNSQPTINDKQTILKDDGGFEEMKTYRNGSTPEPVYADTNLSIKVGSLDPYETCNAVADVDGKIGVLYNTPNGKKLGFTKYRGGL